MESAIRKYGDIDIKWSAQGMMRLTQEAMRKLFMPTILKIKEAVGTVMVANGDTGMILSTSSCILTENYNTYNKPRLSTLILLTKDFSMKI